MYLCPDFLDIFIANSFSLCDIGAFKFNDLGLLYVKRKKSMLFPYEYPNFNLLQKTRTED